MLTQQPTIRSIERGFTLIELMVALGLGMLVMGATVSIITSHIRSSATAERSQRVRDDSNRLNYLLQVEAGEAAQIRTSVAVASTVCGSAFTSLFTLDIPKPDDPSSTTDVPSYYTNQALSNFTSIHYYQQGADLMRCGSPINRNGSLNSLSGSFVNGIVSSGTTMTVQGVTCQNVTTTSRAVAYQVSYREAGMPGSTTSYQPPCEIARAKSFLIEDPVDPDAL